MARTAAPQPPYRLADHVRACHVDGQVILLDLHHDRYIGVAGPQASAAAHWVADWPTAGLQPCEAPASSAVESWVSKLHEAGLLVKTPPTLRQPDPLEDALETLATSDLQQSRGVQWRRMAAICCATFVASRWLKRRSLAGIAEALRGLRHGRESMGDEPTEALRCASSWYLRMRPFAISSQDQCLHDSLTLLHFLATERIYPRWVIGVRTRPFAAHSWVQAQHLVLNDLHENVRAYTPILVV
ncbi:lasso peptide biosynthesis B2 protein [Pelomonas aquatica]|jgi:hypothetical protein|uniref:Lasso peptide biosynthesis B2 protein n=1 Tax=Pelomonas aquatica TaxID=431058 RepID=A0A9X4R6Q5_9BURK|nr:lasso peptide biosynthesis B2 protein [Pelomonas aquatica]MDG0861523.1 lasso peptide biosynthesis B2 protein [Pelomonas aquatica]